ncbi:MAG: ATP-binding cassette domain-containing protein [Acidobacteria bacterium]|nr:ATP-binding cassette domain-containing protein [Acidobacteriota bacterium]
MPELMRLLRSVRSYRWHLAGGLVMMLGVGLFEAVAALLIGPVFDRVLAPDAADSTVALVKIPWLDFTIYLDQLLPSWIHNVWTVVAVFILGVSIGKAVCEYAANYLINLVGYSVIMDLRNQLYEKILGQSISFYHRYSTGMLMSTVLSDIERIQLAVSQVLADFLRQTFTLLALLIVVILIDWRLATVSLTLIPFVMIPSMRIGRRIRSSTRKSQDNLAGLSQLLQETISGNRIVKAFRMEQWELARFKQAARELLRINLRYAAAQAATSPLMEVLGAITIVFLLLYARNRILMNDLTTGMFVSFIYALFKMYEPVKRISGINNSFQQALGASSKVYELLDAPEEVTEQTNAVALPPFSRSIVYDNVSFSYQDSPAGPTENEALLRSISLEVKAGQVVAIVGASGAGKSTLANLLPRFFDVTGGRLLIDGVDVRNATLDSLRGQISMVTQENILFNDTIQNNICYGRKEVSTDELEQASAAALALDFIRQMPDGFKTIIADRGDRLSGGQRQRLAIARALLKNAPILILDEATSELDTESEQLVQKALANLMQGRTVIVIAHRLSTVRRADKIVVLEGGGIREMGTHGELMALGGSYRRLHDMQFRDANEIAHRVT